MGYHETLHLKLLLELCLYMTKPEECQQKVMIQVICLCIHYIPLQEVRFCVSNYSKRKTQLAVK